MKAKSHMKGMSLSLETVVLLILMAIVLGALLAFFLGVFNPAKGRIDSLRNKESFCLKYTSYDPSCSAADKINKEEKPFGERGFEDAKAALSGIMGICNKPADDPVCGRGLSKPTECLKDCCAGYCR